MKNIIEKILQADENARKLAEKTEMKKSALQADILAQKEKIRAEYMQSAESEIKVQLAQHQKKADDDWEQASKKYKKIGDNLQFQYSANLEKWANDIVSRVLEI